MIILIIYSTYLHQYNLYVTKFQNYYDSVIFFKWNWSIFLRPYTFWIFLQSWMVLLTSNTVAIGPQTTQKKYINNVFAVLKWPCVWWWIFTSRDLWAFFLSIIVIYNYSISFTKTNNYEYLKLLNISVENGNLKKATVPSSINCS